MASRVLDGLAQARRRDSWAVHRLFEALHAYNATLDPRFGLAADWRVHLDRHLAHEHDGGSSLTLLAWEAGEPVGFIMMAGHTESPMFAHRHWAELVAIFVVPEVRGSGVATALIDAGATWARRQSFDRIQLYVSAGNEVARRFYDRHGFQCVQEVWRLDLG